MAASPDPESTSGHGPGGTGGHGSRAIIAALLANGAIATAKFVGFAITGASSMLAEAVHSVADSGNQALLLLGARRSRRAADDVHAFGYGRESYFWAFVVALVLFTRPSTSSATPNRSRTPRGRSASSGSPWWPRATRSGPPWSRPGR